MPTDATITFIAGNLPAGACYASEQARLSAFAANLSGQLPGTFNSVVVGAATPGADDRDKPWLADDGRLWLFNLPGLGAWVSRHPMAVGAVMLYEGSEASIVTFDGGEAGVATPSTGQMWEKVSQMDGRVPVGPGTLSPSGAPVAIGDTGGADRVALLINEIPPHNHALKCWGAAAGSTDRPQWIANGTVERSFNTENSGGNPAGTAADTHQNMPPYRGIWFIRRTARIWYRR